MIEDLLRRVKDQHTTGNLSYSFAPEALKQFKAFYGEVNSLINSTDIFTEADQRSVLSKMQVSKHFTFSIIQAALYVCNLS